MLSLIAYTNTLSAAPGEVIEVKASSYGARFYRADLRRVIQGDRHPQGPGYKDEPVTLDLGGVRPARRQAIRPGSYVRIEDRGNVLADLASFTLAVPVQPTLMSGERTIFLLSNPGLELLIDSNGRPGARLGETKLSLKETLIRGQWTLLVVSCDKAAKTLQLSAVSPAGHIVETGRTSAAPRKLEGQMTTVMIAARAPGEGHFDGKIDSPVLFDRPLEPLEAMTRLALPQTLSRSPDLIAHWDFSRAMEGTDVIDASPHQLHGVTVQCPARAMTGWRWTGQCLDWRRQSELYSAIHFHADDMTDAGWVTDFTVTLPADLRSGLYAIRLVPDDDETQAYHCVFAVRPPRHGATGNTVCFLMPTASYLAYANHRLGLDVPGTEVGMGRLVEIDRHHAFLQEHPELGFSFYEVHADGSGVFHSSRNRPVLDLQPGVKGFLGGLGSNIWQFNADTHITGWLDHHGIDCDVITDEDLHREGLSLLRRYNVVLTGTHPEYYSLEMLDAVQGFVDRGGKLIYLGGNGFYWRISFSDRHPGVIECRRSEAGIRPWEPGPGQFHHAFTGEYGGLWRRNGRPSTHLTGLIMSSQGFDISEPYELTEAASDPRADFIFAGIDRSPGRKFGAFGLSGKGAAGMEIDRADFTLGTPPQALILGSSRSHTDIYLMTPEDMLDPTPDMSGTQNEAIRSDLVYFETDGGGAVFSTGSIAWAGAMAWNFYDNEVSRMTLNVLKRFDRQG
ncbi:N,N-dimethylformamidase beta subunit family domain-containing protein [Taklimakanibacter lacteus]|uniref:N,N-dimethylformamidase beta subunit family domain-containing protein n=1 Tax=Taklimakanibacter lacteus TaxID=2268456 RepID=UPI000E667A97